jgi:hypothetical protein
VEQLGPGTNHPTFIIQLHNIQLKLRRHPSLFNLRRHQALLHAATTSFFNFGPQQAFSACADFKLFQLYHHKFLHIS